MFLPSPPCHSPFCPLPSLSIPKPAGNYYILRYLFALAIAFGESVALLVASRTNNRKVVDSMPAKVVCTVFIGNRLVINCPL